MDREERKRRFSEAIVNTLYPSSPRPEQELEPVGALIEGSCSDVISGILAVDGENTSTSGDEEEQHDSESETERLTRAQRKKIRKKKLKEEAIRRGKLIGPLLPLSPITTSKVAEDVPAVRPNASEEGDETAACANSKKLKHRRMAKRLAKEKRVASALENCDQTSISSDAVCK